MGHTPSARDFDTYFILSLFDIVFSENAEDHDACETWCDHTEGFESGLDVGEWERASGIALADAVKFSVMMHVAPIFLRNSLQLRTNPNSASL